MTPDQFDSFRMGVDLTAANYSGGAGGTFTDQVQGSGFWTVDGGTPSFEARAGLEGMLFTGASTDSILAPMLCLHEATILAIGQGATGTQTALYGGTNTATNTWFGSLNGNRLITSSPPATAAVSAVNSAASSAPTVFVSSWSPRAPALYAQINDGPVTTSSGVGTATRINWAEMAIGRHRTSYFSGWIARVLVFSRALHERDPSGLAALVTAEMARVGL